MAGAPVAGDTNFDQPIIHYIPTNPSNFTISQFTSTAKTSNPSPNIPPLTVSLGKRRKSKPLRYGGGSTTVVEDTKSPNNNNNVLEDSSRKCLSFQKQKCGSKCVKYPVMIRADELQLSLGNEHPSCMKTMVKSHVDFGYWMGFPQWFGNMFLPKTDSEMEIEDENGEVHVIRYNADKSGLSAGWKKFAAGHKLVEGDVLIFHLVEPLRFKVYIIRANDVNEQDGARGLLNLETDTKQANTLSPTKKKKCPKSLPLIPVQKKRKVSTPPSQISSRLMEQSGNDSEEVGSEVLEGSRPYKPDLSFQEFKTFEEFHIMVKGTCIDSEFPDDVRMNYYELCISRNELLHDSLPEGMYCKLAAGIIGETVNIANEIKKCKLTTTKEEFEAWDNSLKSFDLLGMKVGFLRDRIMTLSRLVFESEGRLDIQKYMESKNKQERVEDEILGMSLKLVALKESSRKLKGIVDGLKQKGGRYEVMFQEEIDAPW